MAEVTCRFIEEVGTRAWLRVYWGESKVCPNRWGPGRPGGHDAQIFLMDSDQLAFWKLGGDKEDYPDDRWPQKCDHCDTVVPPYDPEAEGEHRLHRQVHRKRLYNTDSGQPEIGDMFWHDWMHDEDEKREDGSYPCFNWTNCMGPHLYVILPNGDSWDVDTRATNCTLKDDKTHRCWIRTGDPPLVTAGKKGHTCSAGAGSIASGSGKNRYHGFLRNGKLT